MANYSNASIIYMDGSRMNEKTGYAIYSTKPTINIKKRIDNRFSIFDAEVLALLHATTIVFNQNIKNVIIATDSLSSIEGLISNIDNSRVSYLLVNLKDNLCILEFRGFKIMIIWIQSHKGIVGNEVADKIAKDSLNIPALVDELKISYHNLFPIFPILKKNASVNQITLS